MNHWELVEQAGNLYQDSCIVDAFSILRQAIQDEGIFEQTNVIRADKFSDLVRQSEDAMIKRISTNLSRSQKNSKHNVEDSLSHTNSSLNLSKNLSSQTEVQKQPSGVDSLLNIPFVVKEKEKRNSLTVEGLIHAPHVLQDLVENLDDQEIKETLRRRTSSIDQPHVRMRMPTSLASRFSRRPSISESFEIGQRSHRSISLSNNQIEPVSVDALDQTLLDIEEMYNKSKKG